MKKIVVFQGGIGNQLFQYCLYKYLESTGFKVSLLNLVNNDHQGYILEKYFNVILEPCNEFYSVIFKKFIMKLYRRSVRIIISDDNHFCTSWNTLYFFGNWQDKKFFLNELSLSFRGISLNSKNKEILNLIKSTNSVSIHVRRGDYLNQQNLAKFGNVCTKHYYENALKVISDRIEDPCFIVFSDDIDWCKENLIIPFGKFQFVDWNIGDDSIIDMFLMSKCKANIIANSTFSYWGAKLSDNKLVIYPSKWFNNGDDAPDIFPDGWIGINL